MAAKKEEEKLDLDKMIEDLGEDAISKKIITPHEEARVSYKLDKIKVSGYDDFRKKITDYMQHHHKKVMGGGTMPAETAFVDAHNILEQAYGKEGGFEGAYKKAKKGQLREVIDMLAHSLKAQHQNKYVTNILMQIDPTDFGTHVKVADKYITKFKKYLPKDMQTKSPQELARDYKDIIQQHAGVVNNIRDVLKKGEYKKK